MLAKTEANILGKNGSGYFFIGMSYIFGIFAAFGCQLLYRYFVKKFGKQKQIFDEFSDCETPEDDTSCDEL